MPLFPSPPPANRESIQQPTVRHLQIFVLFNGPDTTAHALRAASSFAADLGGEILVAAPLIVPYPLPLDRPATSKRTLLAQIAGCISESGIQRAAIHKLLIAYSREARDGWRTLLPAGCIVVIGKPNRLSPVRRWKTRQCAEYLRSLGHEVVLAFGGTRARRARY